MVEKAPKARSEGVLIPPRNYNLYGYVVAVTKELKVGQAAPTFALLDQDGETVRLTKQKGTKVLLYFYPRANTPGCTKQACGLRDIADDVDVTIIGVSPDKPESQAKFDRKYKLGFSLLSDVDHSVAEAYGVWREKKNFGITYRGILRSAFLIDEQGKVEKVWYNIKPGATPKNLLAALAEER